MRVKFFPKQEEFISHALHLVQNDDGIWRNAWKIIWYGGGVRGGKTVAGLGAIILFCKLFPGSRWVVVRRSIEDIKRNTLTDFYQLYPPDKLKQKPTASNSWTAILSNGPDKPTSEIVFFGENYDRDKLHMRWRGLASNGMLLEEGNELQWSSYQKAIERTGTWKQGQTWNIQGREIYPSLILVTCNPARNWAKDKIYDKWEDKTLPKGIHYIQSRAYDNPHIPAAWIADQKDLLDDATFEMFIEGNWNMTFNDRPWIRTFNRSQHLYSGHSDELIRRGKLHLICDQNVEPPALIVCQWGKGWYHLIDETDFDKGDVYAVARWVLMNYPGFEYAIGGDASGRKRVLEVKGNLSFYQILQTQLTIKRDGREIVPVIVAPKANLPLIKSRVLCNAVLKTHPAVRIAEHCKNTIGDIEAAKADKEGNLVKSRKDESEYLDHFDCFRYSIHLAFPDWVENRWKYL
jgi:hypothetical protein